MGSRHISQNNKKSWVLGKAKQQSNIRASGGTIKREIITLLLALLALGNRQVSMFPPTVGGKVINTLLQNKSNMEASSRAQGKNLAVRSTPEALQELKKEAGGFQCAEILLCKEFPAYFFLKNTKLKGSPSFG